MMHGGTQKITMGRDKRQDKIDAANAMRNAGAVGGMEGIQFLDGAVHAPDVVKATRNQKYGNVIPGKEMAAGVEFGQQDSDYSALNAAVPATPQGTSGSQAMGVSLTTNPQNDFDDSQVMRRIAAAGAAGAEYGMQAFTGYNDRRMG